MDLKFKVGRYYARLLDLETVKNSFDRDTMYPADQTDWIATPVDRSARQHYQKAGERVVQNLIVVDQRRDPVSKGKNPR